jgi:hypothetical protein
MTLQHLRNHHVIRQVTDVTKFSATPGANLVSIGGTRSLKNGRARYQVDAINRFQPRACPGFLAISASCVGKLGVQNGGIIDDRGICPGIRKYCTFEQIAW